MAGRITPHHGQALIELTTGLIVALLVVSLSAHLIFLLIKSFKHDYVTPLMSQKIEIGELEVKFQKNLVFLQNLSYGKKIKNLKERGWTRVSDIKNSPIPLDLFEGHGKKLFLIDDLGVIQ